MFHTIIRAVISVKSKSITYFFVIAIALSIFLFPVSAKGNSNENKSKKLCGIYFTGVGCPHCASSDPIILKEYPRNHPSLVIIEYEIYQTAGNGKILNEYISNVNVQGGIPQMIIGDEFEAGEYTYGGGPTTTWTKEKMETLESAKCKLYDNSDVSFENLSISSLPGKPKIWTEDKILINTGEEKKNFSKIDPVPAKISEGQIEFDNAVRFGEWIFQWEGKGVEYFNYQYQLLESDNETIYIKSDKFLKKILDSENVSETLEYAKKHYDDIININKNGVKLKSNLSPSKAVELALADAVNPCAIAVMIVMLTAIINYNPDDKKKVLYAGFAFVISIFLTYLFYGVVIVNIFKFIQTLFSSFKSLIYLIVGIFAATLGVMNIYDYINYEPGGFLTEMPKFLRPKMKKVVKGITSPKGAAVTGIFVTLFLLPCTIGPYIAALWMLSFFEFIETLPWLLFYNLIFVSPMIAITVLIYYGAAEVEDISEWRDENIRYLHLGAGIVIFGVGACMVFNLLEWVFMVWPLLVGITLPFVLRYFENQVQAG